MWGPSKHGHGVLRAQRQAWQRRGAACPGAAWRLVSEPQKTGGVGGALKRVPWRSPSGRLPQCLSSLGQLSPVHSATRVPPPGLRESRSRRSGSRRRKRPRGACGTPTSSGARCARTSRSRCRTALPPSRRAGASKRRPRSGVSASMASRRRRWRS